ncbi:MAG: hypothetical protein K6F23_13310, partial [Solobacterium sp.]|nr:hypothetical protein [Solobacterium sp.]
FCPFLHITTGGTAKKTLPRAKMFHGICLLIKDILPNLAPGSIPRAFFLFFTPSNEKRGCFTSVNLTEVF